MEKGLKVIPLNKNLLIMPEKAKKKSEGGIIIPEAKNPKAPTKGIVVALSNDCQFKLGDNEPCKQQTIIMPGDMVMFSKFSGTELNLFTASGKEEVFVLVPDDKILAVLKKPVESEKEPPRIITPGEENAK